MRIKMKICFIYFKVEGDFHIKIGSRGKLKITLVSGAENGFGKKTLNTWRTAGVIQENREYQKKNEPE